MGSSEIDLAYERALAAEEEAGRPDPGTTARHPTLRKDGLGWYLVDQGRRIRILGGATKRRFREADGDLFDAEVGMIAKIIDQVESVANPPGYNLARFALVEDGSVTTWIDLVSNRIRMNRRLEVETGGGGRAQLTSDDDPSRQRAILRLHNATWPRVEVCGPDDADDADTVLLRRADVEVDAGSVTRRYRIARQHSGVEWLGEWLLGTTGDVPAVFMWLQDGGSVVGDVRLQSGLMRVMHDAEVTGDFDVDGTKNARIADPAEPSKAYRFAAVEFDSPGTLGTTIRDVEVYQSREARVPVPAHFARIGTQPTVFATYAAEPSETTPHGPWAFVEGWEDGSPEIVLRAPKGRYHLLLLFTRADPAVDGWRHEVGARDDDPSVT